MSLHIKADLNAISDIVLLSGNPLRTKFIADQYLKNIKCYMDYRNMLGYTGIYHDHMVSVQSCGMGIPSAAIYMEELIRDYGVKKIVRIGTCGALQKNLKVGSYMIPITACTDSNYNKKIFNDLDFAPHASFELLKQADEIAHKKNIEITIGSVLTTDTYYNLKPELREPFIQHNVLCVDMETSVMYSLACRYNVRAVAILLVTSNRYTDSRISDEEQKEFLPSFIDYCLEVLVSN